jgi:hypothetical protein
MQIDITRKLSWRLKELPAATGLTEAFWRKVVRLKKIKARRVEGAIVILDSDLKAFLAGKEEAQKSDSSLPATV